MDAEPGPTPKPQNETTPDSNSLSSTTETSSESPACTTSSDSKPVTLSSTSNNTQLGYPYFSKLLQGVMAANSAVSSHPSAKNVRFQGQFGMSHQEALATVTAKAAQSQQLQARSSELLIDLPRNKKPESSVPSSSPILLKKKPSLQTTDLIQKQNGMNSSDHVSENSTLPPHNPLSVQLYKEKVDKHGNTWLSQEQTDDIPKTPNSDGYCWRKYGQKTVKNSGSSRSYYRCTYLNCSAKKKVQHLDGSGRIIAVVYKGDHNHDPPQYLRSSSRKRDASSTSQVNDPGDRAQKLDDPHTPTSTKCMKEAEQASVPIMHECQDSSLRSSACISKGDAREEPTEKSDPMHSIESETVTLPSETEHCKVSKSNEIVISDPMKEFGVVPLKKRRIKEGSKACSESVYRTFKEPKVVVHATRDVESSSDGYRWRKYGQKMVKGNPNPRSYYRCSSAGCPVRKHVERATDDSTTVLVTYEGTHDHDKPVFKKCHGSPKSPALVAATTTLVQKPEAKSPPMSQEPSQGSDKATEGGSDKATEGGSDKVLESARTLLSIGIELKSC